MHAEANKIVKLKKYKNTKNLINENGCNINLKFIIIFSKN